MKPSILRNFLTLVMCAGSLVSAQGAPAPLLWTNTSGVSIPGEFVKIDGDAVIILKDDKEFTIPLANLAPASREQAWKIAESPVATRKLQVPQDGAGRLVTLSLLSSHKASPLGLVSLPPDIAQATNVVRLSVFRHHALALTKDGKVLSWGRRAEDLPPLPPEMLGTEKKVVQLIAGYSDMVLLEDGEIRQNGRTNLLSIPEGMVITRIEGYSPYWFAFNAMGHATYIGAKNFSPAPPMFVPDELRGVPIRTLLGTNSNALALTSKGEFFLWGSNTSQLPILPDELTNLISKGDQVAASAMGYNVCLAIMKSGKPILWGPAASLYVVGVKNIKNVLNITHLCDGGITNAFAIQYQKGNDKSYEFFTTKRWDPSVTKDLIRYNPTALAASEGAVAMIVPPGRR